MLSPVFDRFILACILLVGAATAVQLSVGDGRGGGDTPSWARFFLAVTQSISLTVFSAEVVVKLVACGEAPLEFATDPEVRQGTVCHGAKG